MGVNVSSDIAKQYDTQAANNVDVVIVGAGFAGLYTLYNLRNQGLKVILLDAAGGVGGTWYWNRYPGVRVDIESMEYSYSFSEELQQEWSWSERYASQAELLRYLNHVADRFDLRKNICLNTRVAATVFDEKTDKWEVETDSGRKITASFCVMATGFLSAANQPKFPGMESFEGEQYHTARWPEGGVDFAGKRVGVIGTGSSGIQVISEIGSKVGHLNVFQRTASFSIPLRNCPMPKDYEKSFKENYPEWRRLQREESFGGYVSCNYKPVERLTQNAMDISPEERLAVYEDRYKSGGLSMYFNFPDVFVDKAANDTIADFLRGKIKERVNDPETAELLTPRGYPALVRRLCADTGYYETYNQDNVDLVDVSGGEIELTPKGIEVKGKEYELDCIIFATGYDALTGALTNIDIRGEGGRQLKEEWSDGPRTALGMMTAGFPNMFFLNGPGSPCPFYQPVLLGEEQGGWVGDWIMDMRAKGLTRMGAKKSFQNEWVEHSSEVVNATLFPLANSWYMGKNIPGKSSVGLVYFGEPADYRKRCANVLPSGYDGFELSGPQK
ncbi:MAG: NAD(P)/FAD-dependent oxidoreductase [Kordiimonadaceae bacterium]|nr:NAD(P)/FAD-dependent oxidoreductase [Kordiimonadaceae bacterium]